MITRFSPELVRLYVSPACRDLLGYEPKELVGMHPRDVVHPVDEEAAGRMLSKRLEADDRKARVDLRMRHKDGRYIWMETSFCCLEDGSGYVSVTRDVSERKALEAQLEDANRQLRVLALEDGLTRLANRRRFDEALGTEYRWALRNGSPLAVAMLDVDCFKAAVRGLAIPYAGSEHGFATVSIGVAALSPGGPQGPAALVEAADAALYEAKRAGRNTVRLADAPAEVAAS